MNKRRIYEWLHIMAAIITMGIIAFFAVALYGLVTETDQWKIERKAAQRQAAHAAIVRHCDARHRDRNDAMLCVARLKGTL